MSTALDVQVAAALVTCGGRPLFMRSYSLVVGTRDVSKLAFSFQVKKSLKAGVPNTCDLKLRNLKDDSRLYLEGLGDNVPVQLSAGYAAPVGTSQIYLGTVRSVLPSVTEGADVVTELSSGDGEKARRNRITKFYAQGSSPLQALQDIVATLGIGSGNVSATLQKAFASSARTAMFSGVALKAEAAYYLDAMCKSAGFEWSIQDSQLQIVNIGATLAGEAILLNSQTGMVGSPAADNKGIVSVTTLMIPDLRPGKAVVFDAKRLKGNFRIETCEYQGDTYGTPWYCHLTCKAIK